MRTGTGNGRGLVLLGILLTINCLEWNGTKIPSEDANPGDILEIIGQVRPLGMKYAGIYFPDQIHSGNDDRQIFLVLLTLQKLGYFIDVIVTETNPCQTYGDLEKVAAALFISLSISNQMRIVIVRTPHKMLTPILKYHIFVSNGREKLPNVDGIGSQLNFYVCNYPLDGYLEYSDPHMRWFRLKSYSSYDFILVDYIFTYELLVHLLMQTSIKEITRHQKSYPSVYVLPTPTFVPSLILPDRDISSTNILIVMTTSHPAECRIYLNALNFLLLSHQEIVQQSHRVLIFSLILALPSLRGEQLCLGNLSATYQSMRQNSATFSVLFLKREDSATLSRQLASSDLIWLVPWDPSLSSSNSSAHSLLSSSTANDPRRWKVFSSIVLDAMSNGCIPITFSDSTTQNLIHHSHNGYVVERFNEYAFQTLTVLRGANMSQVRKNARETASYFTFGRFSNTLKILMRRYLKSKSFRQFTLTSLPILRRKKHQTAHNVSKYSAIIFEPHLVNTFEYSVKNMILFTGMKLHPNSSIGRTLYSQNWALHIYHTKGNEEFVKFILRSIPNVNYHLIPYDLAHSNSQNMLLRTSSFWDSLNGIEKVLLFQSNSLVLQGTLPMFLSYDFITAPIFCQTNTESHSTGILTGICRNRDGVMESDSPKFYDYYRSGSFSLRSVSLMKKICDDQLTLNNSNLVANQSEEDYFMSHLATLSDSNFHLPSGNLSEQFCLIMPKETLSENESKSILPFAVHVCWEYYSPIQSLQFFKTSLRNMLACC